MKDSTNSFLDHALKCLQNNFSVIPVKPNKVPYIDWKPFQKHLPSEEEVKRWWEKWRFANIGIVTGKISGICVIDCDTKEGQAKVDKLIPESLENLLPDGIDIPTVKTPRGGKHYYFKMPDEPIGNNTGIMSGVDFRGEGGYVISPVSVNGEWYGRSYIQ